MNAQLPEQRTCRMNMTMNFFIADSPAHAKIGIKYENILFYKLKARFNKVIFGGYEKE